MPFKPARQCRIPYCPHLTHDPTGYCDVHAEHRGIHRGIDRRPSPARRGYGHAWKEIRKEVLAAHDIPLKLWPEYDIDHNPRYDPAIEPDHRKYRLIPRLRCVHSRKTIREDGGFGRKRSYGGMGDSSGPLGIDRMGDSRINAREFWGGGL